MFASYREIFDRRGAAYHEAMRRHPRVRDLEFANVLAQARLGAGQTLCDLPSGGGYLAERVSPEPGVRVLSVETSSQFFDARPAPAHSHRILCDLAAVPLRAGAADVVVSLAGLHHVDDKQAFVVESHRLLRSGGRLCIADVHESSPVAEFLDGFVGDHSSTGHRGAYLTDGLSQIIEDCGFAVVYDAAVAYPWTFDSLGDLAAFCTLLFGLDLAAPADVIRGVEHHLGIEEESGAVSIPWQLTFLTAEKRGQTRV